MSEFFNQYFDFTIMGDHFSEVLEGFLKNLLLFAVVLVLALTWGLILALLLFALWAAVVGVVKDIPRRQLSGASGWTPQSITHPLPEVPSTTAGVPSGYLPTTVPQPLN